MRPIQSEGLKEISRGLSVSDTPGTLHKMNPPRRGGRKPLCPQKFHIRYFESYFTPFLSSKVFNSSCFQFIPKAVLSMISFVLLGIVQKQFRKKY